MYRVGIHFTNLTSTLQSGLDRFLFKLMRREARAKRHLRGSLYLATRPRFHERRATHRMVIPAEMKLSAHIAPRKATLDQPLPLADQARVMADGQLAATPMRVIDISSSGCSLACPDEVKLRTRQTVTVEFDCEDLCSPLDGWVIYIMRRKARAD
jgi:hypothetical protein